MTKDQAQAIAAAIAEAVGPRLKSVHVQPKLHEGIVNARICLWPLSSKEVPEPETFIFNSEELVGVRGRTDSPTGSEPVRPSGWTQLVEYLKALYR